MTTMGALLFVILSLMSFSILIIAEQPFDHCTCRGRIINCRRRVSYFYRYRVGSQGNSFSTTQPSTSANSVPYIDIKTICPNATDAQLSSLNLRVFPDGLEKNITKIDLSSNMITALPSAGKLNSNVKYLDLSANEIANATEELRPLGALEELRLGWNRLRHLRFLPAPCALHRLQLTVNFITSLEGDSLRRCAQLETFTILANNVTELPNGVFAGLGQLRDLTLSKNPIQELGDRAFENLPQLETLRMDGALLTTLPNNVFSSLEHLHLLVLAENPFRSLPSGAFSGLVQLRALNLGNALHNVTLSDNLFVDLRNLRELYLDHNSLTLLPENLFQTLNELEELHLESNKLSHVSENAFVSLRNLKVLRLDRNRFAEISGSVLCNPPSLRELQMPYNRLTTLPDLGACESLRTANFFNNSMVTPSEAQLRAALGGEQRQVSLEENPVRASSLRWVLRAEGVDTFRAPYGGCACGGLRSAAKGAEVRFCVAAPCGPGTPFASWMEAVAGANDAAAASPHAVP